MVRFVNTLVLVVVVWRIVVRTDSCTWPLTVVVSVRVRKTVLRKVCTEVRVTLRITVSISVRAMLEVRRTTVLVVRVVVVKMVTVLVDRLVSVQVALLRLVTVTVVVLATIGQQPSQGQMLVTCAAVPHSHRASANSKSGNPPISGNLRIVLGRPRVY